MDISIVLPSYNDGKNLLATLASIFVERESEFEVIVVDDGTAAGCFPDGELLRDPRVKVERHPFNMGVSAARNTGIKAAKGEYLCFADCGDVLHPGGLSVLLRHARATEADVVIGKYRLDVCADLLSMGAKAQDLFPDQCIAPAAPAGVYGRSRFVELLAELLIEDLFHPVAARLYRSEALGEVRFDEAIYCQLEDEVFNTAIYRKVNRIAVVDSLVATVRSCGPGALSNLYDSDRRFNLLKLWNGYEALMEEMNVAPDSVLALECRRQLLFHYISLLSNWRREAKRMDSAAVFYVARQLLYQEPFRMAAEHLGLTEQFLVSTMNVVVDAVLPGLRRRSLLCEQCRDGIEYLALTLEMVRAGDPPRAEKYASLSREFGGAEAGLSLVPDSLWRVWE